MISAAAIIADYTVEKRPTSWHVERALQFIAECREENAPVCESAENDYEAAEVLEPVTL